MVDRRLSADPQVFDTCDHPCCLQPDDPNHRHLFGPEKCPVCRATVERQSRLNHPSNRH